MPDVYVTHFVAWNATHTAIHREATCRRFTADMSMGRAMTRREAIIADDLPLCSECCYVEIEDRTDAQAMARLLWSQRIEPDDGRCIVCSAIRVRDARPGHNSSTLTHTVDCIVPLAWVFQDRIEA